MILLAHRGASADAPENTLPAFQEAISQAADGVELDVMVCGSGELVVCHDEWLDRLAGVHLELRTTPYEALRGVDVGTRLGFAPARIPLLTEVIDLLPAGFLLNLELKCDAPDDGGLSVAVARLVRDRHLGGRTVISSFNPANLAKVAAEAPTLARGLLLDPDLPLEPQLARLPEVANYSVHPHHSLVTPERMNDWRLRGLEVAVWTVDAPEVATRMARLGVRYCITNTPRALRPFSSRGRG